MARLAGVDVQAFRDEDGSLRAVVEGREHVIVPARDWHRLMEAFRSGVRDLYQTDDEAEYAMTPRGPIAILDAVRYGAILAALERLLDWYDEQR